MMIFHSTNSVARPVSLAGAISNGLAPDGGLYIPSSFPTVPRAFFRNISEMTLADIAFVVCNTLWGDILPAPVIKQIITEAVTFAIPTRKILLDRPDGPGREGLLLELFHGPTHSFKDLGARFMAALLPRLLPERERFDIIVATSGDSGGALASAFAPENGSKGSKPQANVIILYPRGELSKVQTDTFTRYPHVTAIEVGGTFDDCQRLAKEALADECINRRRPLTSGNSINLARMLPAIIAYFYAFGRAQAQNPDAKEITVGIPCGNLGNLSAALMAKRMGVPIRRVIGANNANDTFVEYLKTGDLRPRRALLTLARAMDVGNPSNLARIISLYKGDLEGIRRDVAGVAYDDRDIIDTIREVCDRHGILLGPQSATAWRALAEAPADGSLPVVMATGHPAKFPRATREAIGREVPLPVSAPHTQRAAMHKIPPTLNALKRALAIN